MPVPDPERAGNVAPTLMRAARLTGSEPTGSGHMVPDLRCVLLEAVDAVLSAGAAMAPGAPPLDRHGEDELDRLLSSIGGADDSGAEEYLGPCEQALRLAFILRSGPRPAADYWCKVLGMLMQNWAVVEAGGSGASVIFCNDDGAVFDELQFPNREAAEAGLLRNGFARVKGFPSPPEGPLFAVKVNNSGAYSSGGYWRD